MRLASLIIIGLAVGCVADTSEDSAAISPSPNDQHAFEFFVGKGLTDVQSAGIIGNLDQESQMNPNAIQPGGPGRGIAQWSAGARWEDLVAYASSIGQSPWSLDVQLAFVWRELPSYGLGALRNATTVEDATTIFENKFELCGNCQIAQRISYARAALAAYGGHTHPVEDRVAFQANTHDLWTQGGDALLGMMAGTSPSIAALSGGGYEIAFQANTGVLWTTGTAGTRNWGLGMMSGTSPSIAALANGGYEVAFQANTSSLWTAGTADIRDWHLGLRAGTSPSIAGLTGGGYQFAFQANTGTLWTGGAAGIWDWSLGMADRTNPSITALPNNGWEVAFQANSTSLWTAGTAGLRDWQLGLDPASSPSIAAAGDGFTVAFQANTNTLWFAGTRGVQPTNLGMKAGTSPGISHVHPDRAYFQANTGTLWSSATGSLSLGMENPTSPSGT